MTAENPERSQNEAEISISQEADYWFATRAENEIELELESVLASLANNDVHEMDTMTRGHLSNGNSALEQKTTNLVDDRGSLHDKPAANPMDCLQVELFGAFQGHEPHRRSLDRLGDGFRVPVVVLLPL
jgi:hypothetical protein